MVGNLVEEFGEVRMDPGLENDKRLRYRIQYSIGHGLNTGSVAYRTYFHTVWGAGKPNRRSSRPRHPGVRGQS